MMFQRSALIAILSLSGLSIVDAFSSIRTTRQVVANHANQFNVADMRLPLPSTCLRMAEEDSSQETTEETENGDGVTAVTGANDILSSPAFLKRKLEVLETDITNSEEELAKAMERLEVAKEEWGPQFDNLSREYTNIQERMTEQNQEGDADAIVRVVSAVLDLLDTFNRASEVIIPETDSEKAIEAAYKSAYQDIISQFEKLGVTEVETIGTEFDYELHQAVMQMPDPDYEEGFICKEFQKGFIILGEEPKDEEKERQDTLIRPAMVAVAA